MTPTHVTTDGIEVTAVHYTPDSDLPDAVTPEGYRTAGDNPDGPALGSHPFGQVLRDNPDDDHPTGVTPVEVWVITFPDGTVKTAHPTVFDTEFTPIQEG